MVIDTYMQPVLFKPICRDEARLKHRCDEMNFHKMNPSDMDLLKKQLELADIKQVFLLPEDCSFSSGISEISNEEIALLVSLEPELFTGFASVDPRIEGCAEKLEDAFVRLGLKGLALNTSRLHIYPDDSRIKPLMEVCKRYGKPAIFHAGFSLENNSFAKYARPMDFEELISEYPSVNICIAHMGWPWVQETCALMIKYPNVYANTALMNFDGPYQIMEKVFCQDMGRYWLDHNLSQRVMFGSDYPRVRPVRLKRGLDSIEMEQETRENVYFRNALRFMGREVNQ